MSNLEETKDQKLAKLLATGLIDNVEAFENLSRNQIDFLTERVSALKRPEFNEEEIDKLCKSDLVKDVIQSQLNQEVIKRRKAEQELTQFKSTLKTKIEDLASLIKK